MYEYIVKEVSNFFLTPMIEEPEHLVLHFHHPHAEQLDKVGADLGVNDLQSQSILDDFKG